MSNFKVVITDYTYENLDVERKILSQRDDIEVLDYQDRTEEGVMRFSSDCDVLVCQYSAITRRVIENLKNCKMIIRYAIGVDNIDLVAAGEHGIPVVNVPDYGIDEVSTHAVTLILAAMRKLPQTLKDVRDRKWNYALIKPLYRTYGSTLGLVGLGRIPSDVARKMSGFGMKILAYDPYAPSERAAALGVELVDLDRLLKESDCISIHCPLTEQTYHMLFANAIIQSKWGRAMMAIKDADLAVEACGIKLSSVKIFAFTLCCIYGCIGGALYGHLIGYISPTDFTMDTTVRYLMMLMIGGIGSLGGNMLGAIIINMLPEALRFLDTYYWLVFSIVVLISSILIPNGLVSVLKKWVRKIISDKGKNAVHTTSEGGK